jgi:hypothetical protein
MSHPPGHVSCDECGALAKTIHVLPSGERPERIALACASHDPGGEWWDLTDLDDCARALQNGAAFDELRPGISDALRAAHREAAERLVDIPCIVCSTIAHLRAGATELTCARCDGLYTFRACAQCGAVDQVGPKSALRGRWHCRFCARDNLVQQRTTPTLSAQVRFDELESHGMTRLDPDVRLVTGFTHFGGTGFPIEPGSLCSVVSSSDGVVVTAERRDDKRFAAVIPYGDLTSLELEGGARTTGGGFIGGGFGAGAAVEGMVAASILNAASRRTKVNSVMRIGTRQEEVLLHHGKLTPVQIRRDLSPLFTRYEAAKHSGRAQAAQHDPIAQLERLAKLREVGAITEEEFQAARAPYVHQLTDGN